MDLHKSASANVEAPEDRAGAAVGADVSLALFDQILDIVSDAVISVDAEHRILSCNRAGEEMFGYAAGDLVGRPISVLVPENLRATHENHLARFALGSVSHRIMSTRPILLGRRRDGEEFPVEISISRLVVDDKPTLTAVVRDARYRLLIEHAHDSVLIFDAESRIVYTSPRIKDLLGLTPEEFVDTELWSVVHPDDIAVAQRQFEQVRSAPPGATVAIGGEIRVRHADGSWRWVRGPATNLLDDPRVAGIVFTPRDVTDRKRLEEELKRQALHDDLTGLANRVLFENLVDRALANANRNGTSTAVVYFDVDRFHTVNERLGHKAGDELLRAIAARLVAAVRTTDVVARIGNDEFAVLVEDVEHDAAALHLAEDYQEATFLTYRHDDVKIPITTSAGVAVWKGDRVGGDALTSEAAIAAARAKTAGNGCLEVFDPALRVEIVKRLELELGLQRALERGELRVHFQPVVDLSDERTVGFEALLRWEHPERGLLEAKEFIEVIEHSWLIEPVGRWVIGEVCDQLARWDASETGHVLVSANLSTRQLTDDLPGVVAEAIQHSGVDPARIWLEITETALMDDLERSERLLGRLHDLGTTIVIDDFGTGYSSLSYLKRFPVGVVKIDGSFVDGLGVDRDDTAIVNAVIAVAHGLGLRSVAEGVETEQQVIALRALGCDLAQGYYFARARPEREAFDPIGPTANNGDAEA